ncbi:Asp-tRNA(Asn)/Glu-tRNA(Gln) amidotransferase subunit GatB [candidate division WOR-3 bacterium]|nr:Asp-tRNA(Asn)/Glu-tRNA(Gln) amidotransferase subunit GatB [candidate division WOR-3 bacterium]
MELKPRIGIEVHTQLKTKTKVFCSCPVTFGEEPNTHICPVCMGYPGVLPVLNKKAVELTLRIALALNCEIDMHSRFARKNYFYPDLPKGYQITQYMRPIGRNGYIDIGGKRIRINRVHLEEETAKMIHRGDKTLLDFNRAGVPLVEIVSEPDIESGEEAVLYLKMLQAILRFTGASDADMEKGMMRCEPNISVGVGDELGTKTEIKNLNSFRAVQRGIDYEIKRQTGIIKNGGKVEQVTLLWDEARKETRIMRKKETAADYRYFPEPDLPPLVLTREYIEGIKKTQPELPYGKKRRYVEDMGLREYEAGIISMDMVMAQYFERASELWDKHQEIAKWIVSELIRYKNYDKLNPENFIQLLKLVDEGKVSRIAAKDVLPEMIESGKSAMEIVKEKNLLQVSDESSLKDMVLEVFNENPKEFERLKNGEDKLIGFFVGQVMKKTKGRADPKVVNRIIRENVKQNNP